MLFLLLATLFSVGSGDKSFGLGTVNNTDQGFVGGYLLIQRSNPATGENLGMGELAALAANAKTLPVNRIWISFFSPDMIYVPGSKDLKYTGLNVTDKGDSGFAQITKYIAQLKAGGVETFLSMGGWNYNCWPYLYTRYSVGGYGTSTPNYWKIQKYGQGNVDNCKESNMWCYTCEPESEKTTIDSFVIFPEIGNSSTYKQAQAYVSSKATGHPVKWHTDIVPGKSYTDSKTGAVLRVPGQSRFADRGRDPYQDIVYLAKDMGAAGIDLDYEEFWHADYFKTASGAKGPWELDQTTYKYAAIAMDLQLNIKAIYPECKLSTASGAVGAWAGKWWGGNMKGIWLSVFKQMPDIINFMASGPNAGGINVMTYDLSDNEQFHECPDTQDCPLVKQVAYYMNTYKTANIPASVGYEIGTPAYPPPDHDKTHQLPLDVDKLSAIISGTQSQHASGFFWELYKPADGHATVNQVAQALCKVILKNDRCSGVIPPPIQPPTPPTPPTPVAPTPPPTPAPIPCGSWTDVCNKCQGGTHNCITCKTDQSKWQCK